MVVALTGLLLLDFEAAATAFAGFLAGSVFFLATVTLLCSFWLPVKPKIFDLELESFTGAGLAVLEAALTGDFDFEG